MNTKDNPTLTRRNAFRGGLAGAAAIGAAALGAPQAQASTPNVPKSWDLDADVVCIGYGGAGAASAITAHDAGAKVIVLEKMPQGGGNTAVSLGGVLCPTNVEDAVTYITALYEFCHSEIDPALIRAYAELAVKNMDWLKGLKEGTQLAPYGGAGYPEVPGSAAIKKYGVRGKNRGATSAASNLWDLYTYAVEEQRKIQVLTSTPAKRLVTDAEGQVVGVIAERDGKEISVRARRGVILTTGGYEYDTAAKQNNLMGYPVYAIGNPGNTGDGIRMAQAAGAGLWHMNGVSGPLGIKVPEFDSALMMEFGQPGYIYVDRDGLRFRDERTVEAHSALLAVNFYDTGALRYPRIPCYGIFDEETRLKGPISVSVGLGYAGKRYAWSADNSAEIAKGWIKKGQTVAELAAAIKVDPANLQATLSRWNADIKNGEDTQFHRPVKAPATAGVAYQDRATPTWSAPLEKPPFYAVELWPSLLNTQGGPRRNVKGQVLDAFGEPIPRLYSAGEIGSMWGIIYQGAGNNAESIIFGQIAGKNAAIETPTG